MKAGWRRAGSSLGSEDATIEDTILRIAEVDGRVQAILSGPRAPRAPLTLESLSGQAAQMRVEAVWSAVRALEMLGRRFEQGNRQAAATAGNLLTGAVDQWFACRELIEGASSSVARLDKELLGLTVTDAFDRVTAGSVAALLRRLPPPLVNGGDAMFDLAYLSFSALAKRAVPRDRYHRWSQDWLARASACLDRLLERDQRASTNPYLVRCLFRAMAVVHDRGAAAREAERLEARHGIDSRSGPCDLILWYHLEAVRLHALDQAKRSLAWKKLKERLLDEWPLPPGRRSGAPPDVMRQAKKLEGQLSTVMKDLADKIASR